MKETKEEIIDAQFLDAKGKTINVKDVILKEDCWKGPKEKFIITYKAAKHLAKLAGISKNFDVEESMDGGGLPMPEICEASPIVCSFFFKPNAVENSSNVLPTSYLSSVDKAPNNSFAFLSSNAALKAL